MNMNAIVSFDKNNANTLHDEMMVLLAPLAEKYGVKIRKAGGSIGTDTTTLKVEFRAEGEDAEKSAFAKNANLFYCTLADYGKMATINRREVKLVGFELKRSKFCIRCFMTDEKKIMLYPEDVLWKFFHTGRNPAAPFAEVSKVNPLEIQKQNDASMKAQGFTHRVDAWIHPSSGSDYQKQQFFKNEPTKAQLFIMLASSEVKTDYKVTAL